MAHKTFSVLKLKSFEDTKSQMDVNGVVCPHGFKTPASLLRSQWIALVFGMQNGAQKRDTLDSVTETSR